MPLIPQAESPLPQAPPPIREPLRRNPQLPQHPLGAYTDSQYEAQQAQLQADTSRRYNDVLRLLGYMDPSTGQFVRGDVELQAARQRGELGRGQELAVEGVTNQAQREGTLFSGRRGTTQARAEHPFVSALADLDIAVPRSLSDLYEQSGNIMSDYNTQQNLYLAQAASRRAANIASAGGSVGASEAAAQGIPDPPPVDPYAHRVGMLPPPVNPVGSYSPAGYVTPGPIAGVGSQGQHQETLDDARTLQGAAKKRLDAVGGGAVMRAM